MSCTIGVVFLTASIVISFAGPIGSHKEHFYESLSTKQKVEYEKIVYERRNIYFEGLALGLFASLLMITQIKRDIKNAYIVPCTAAAITLVTNYLYYILSPKPRSMVISLNEARQRILWYKIYRHMQFVYHTGLVLGIIAAFFLASSFCT